MIQELSFESFTFSKLGEHFHPTEASIYKCFEGKYKLLICLLSLYWSCMEYQFVFSLTNVYDAKEQLNRALSILTCDHQADIRPGGFDSEKLYK